jgi:hypothetical protein
MGMKIESILDLRLAKQVKVAMFYVLFAACLDGLKRGGR